MSDEKGQTAEEKKGREAAEEASALDKLTDRVEEKELDANKVQQAMSSFASPEKTGDQKKREKALAAVKIKQEEVDIIASEFEVDRKTATKALRASRGDLAAALESFL